MNLTKILTGVFLIASLYLAFRLYRSVEGTIEERELISVTEAAVIEKLKLIREAEIVFLSVHGRYTANWDSLADFIENGQVPILQRREIITQKSYGEEDVQVFIDTLGFIPAKERIIYKKYNVNAPDNGVFMGFKVKEGDMVIKNQRAYAIKVGDKTNEPPLQDRGIVTKIEPVAVGNEVVKGQALMVLTEEIFDKNTDFSKIGDVPGRPGLKFNIFAGKVDRSGLKVQVIEVKDPKPINPNRSESNDAKTRKPLHFGSRIDISTAGNWE